VYTKYFEKNPLKLTDEELADREPIEDIFQQITSRTPYFKFASTLIHNPLSELPYFETNLSTAHLTFNSSLSVPTLKPPVKKIKGKKTATMATNDQILNYLKTYTTGSILLRVEPFLGDRTQDPYTWMESFKNAAATNK
ncbi:36962_t:CDS:1, partial [Gigaspora margarita]